MRQIKWDLQVPQLLVFFSFLFISTEGTEMTCHTKWQPLGNHAREIAQFQAIHTYALIILGKILILQLMQSLIIFNFFITSLS